MLTDGYHDVPDGKVAMVVTQLEMKSQAARRDVALPQGVTFRKATPDLAWYRDVYARVGSPWMWFGRRRLDDAALMEILNDPDVAVFTLSRDGQDEALLELDFRQPGACELAHFGLTPKLIGSGAGRYLMNQAIGQAWAAPITRFHLNTCTFDSPQALDFYIRSGFTPYHRKIELADDPRLSGLLPEDAAPHVPLIR